jgi:hypothetical protein
VNACPKCSHRLTDEACAECGWKPGMVIDNATITVKDTVDGTKKRRQGTGYVRKAYNTTLSLDDVDPGVRAAAEKVRKPGQLFKVVSRTEVHVVNP